LIALNRGNHPELARDPSLLKPGIELSVPNRSTTMATRAVQTAESIQRATILAQAATLIVSKINVARAGKGDLPLQYEARLTSIAAKRSNDMIQRSYFEHIDPANGQQPFLRYLQADGYAYQVAGENIAELKNDVGWVPGPLTVAERYSPGELAERFVTGWLGSAEHRTNIYNKSYKRTGVALSTSDDGRRVVATQVFSD
jgi:uncharacterized protein YkwD